MSERDEIERLKARIRTAQLRLDGGNDCFDSLEEVVEATVQGQGEIRRALSKLSKLLKVNADWDRIIAAVESTISSSPTVEAAAARRAETGPLAFGDDWPGIFIRGDSAMSYSVMLERAIRWIEDRGATAGDLTMLLRLLKSSNMALDSFNPANVQHVSAPSAAEKEEVQ